MHTLLPTARQANNNLGLCYAGLGQFDEALRYYQQALGIKEKAYGKVCNASQWLRVSPVSPVCLFMTLSRITRPTPRRW